MKKLLSLFLVIFSIITLASCSNGKKYDIVSTNFVGYDFSRMIAPDLNSTMLLKPGEELHGYSPSVSDIEMIINSKIFIYIGGESDSEFVEKDILKEIDTNKTTVINIMDIVKEKVDQMDLDKLEAMVNRIADKEMKMIEYLGGVLGMLVGAIQWLIQHFLLS